MASYSGANLLAELDVEYEYLGYEHKDFEDLRNHLQLSLTFLQDTDTYATNVEGIMKQAEMYARSFLSQHGKYRTGNLYNSIISERTSSNQWVLHAPARDGKGRYYAGHIEYGFTDKSGRAHGPWPFLRPAVRLAAMDSRGELADALARGVLYGDALTGGYPQWKVAFGRSGQSFSSSKGNRAFNNMSKAYQRNDAKTGKTIKWGAAKNGFNDYRGLYPKGTTSNQLTTGTNEFWDWGEL